MQEASGEAVDSSGDSGKGFSCDICGDVLSHPSHLTRHKRLKHSEMLDNNCPSCDESFSSERGLKLHHKRTHGESLILTTSTCKQCGCEFEHKDKRSPHTCSVECRDKWQTGKNASNWKGGRITIECDWCGCEFEVNQNKSYRRFCDKWCAGKERSLQMRGENNPSWKGGKVWYYGPNWKQQRKKALKRDQYRCQQCGLTERELDRSLHVHHRVKIRRFKDKFDKPEWYEKANELGNLITLCSEHHRKWEDLPVQPPAE